MKKQFKFGLIDVYSKDDTLNTYSVRISYEYTIYYEIKYHKHINGKNIIFNKIKFIPKTEICYSRYSVIRNIYTIELNLFQRILVYIGLKKY